MYEYENMFFWKASQNQSISTSTIHFRTCFYLIYLRHFYYYYYRSILFPVFFGKVKNIFKKLGNKLHSNKQKYLGVWRLGLQEVSFRESVKSSSINTHENRLFKKKVTCTYGDLGLEGQRIHLELRQQIWGKKSPFSKQRW